MHLPPDFADLLAAFAAAEVRYLVIGGYAVGVHDRPRTTKDLDVYLDPARENITRACSALVEFGAPESIISDLSSASPDEIVWWGAPPLRIDFLQHVPGVTFDEAYVRREQIQSGDIVVSVIGLTDLIASKRAAGRDQDLVDAKRLQRRLASKGLAR
jgi:hypothetical protein